MVLSNGVNPATDIRYELPYAAQVSLKIYNLLGEEIRTLVNGSTAAGFHTVHWDSRDDEGKQVPSGVYLYRLEVNSPHNGAPHFTQIKKMTMLR